MRGRLSSQLEDFEKADVLNEVDNQSWSPTCCGRKDMVCQTCDCLYSKSTFDYILSSEGPEGTPAQTSGPSVTDPIHLTLSDCNNYASNPQIEIT